LLIELAFHEDVEEHCDCCEIGQLAADISSPEEWVLALILCVGETDQVDSYVPNDVFLVQGVADCLADLG